MDINTQNKIFSDENLHRYLRENSYWYKLLNRNPLLIDKMKSEMKNKYKLNANDKISQISNKLSLVETLLKMME